MKNKLTTEEQVLQSKLNEAQFGYQEADWKQIESVVAKKGFWANYSTFFKAAALFVALGSAVYIVNSRYQTPNESTTQIAKVKNEEKTNSETESAVEQSEPTVENENTEKAPTDEVAAEGVKRDQSNLIPNKISTGNILSSKESNQKNDVSEGNVKAAKTPTSNLATLEIKEIRILGAPCIGEKLTLELAFRGFYTDEMTVTWKMNGKQLKGQGPRTELELSTAGEYEVSAVVYRKENNIASNSNSLEVKEKAELDFTAEDLKNPFNDEKVKLKIIEPVEGKYIWYENRSTDKLIAGDEVEWAFSSEGHHNMTVEYTSPLGCFQTKTKEVEMDIFFNQEAFPNAFTPTNDRLNDVFELNVLQPYSFKKYELIIQDMDNKIIFQTNVQEENWNGRLQNTGEMLSGKFAWVVKVENEKGEKRTFNGKGKIR